MSNTAQQPSIKTIMAIDPTISTILVTLITTLGSVGVAFAQNRPTKPKKRSRKTAAKQAPKQQPKP